MNRPTYRAPRPGARVHFAALGVALLIGAVVAAPRTADPALPGCSTGEIARLYLGQSMRDGTVSEAAWRDFVDRSLAPRFPDGFTELHAHGRWRDATGRLLEENTRIVEIVHAGTAAGRAGVRDIAADYRARFAQESVLVTSAATLSCS